MRYRLIHLLAAMCAASLPTHARQSSVSVRADQVLHRVTPYLTGACIEDVNHEIYGGIDSQMIFGESFAEPAALPPLKGFSAYDGRWTIAPDGSVRGEGGNGAKIVWNGPAAPEGEVGVEVMLTEGNGGNGGLILNVSGPGKGADEFHGYEVSLERPGFLVIGRHRGNWEPIRRVACDVPLNEWIRLSVRMMPGAFEVFVNDKSITRYEDKEHPLAAGAPGLRIWRHKVGFRNFSVTRGETRTVIPFEYDTGGRPVDEVSGMWRPIRAGDVRGGLGLVSEEPFSGKQSQRIAYAGGGGVIGIENQGLNRRGMTFLQGKSYEGYLWARAAADAEVFVALESKDGSRLFAEQSLKLRADGWQRLDFKLTPRESADQTGRFAIKLARPGEITVGYAFLQPGSWGRFNHLPVRRDVAEALIDQGVRILRYGGSMINNREYRWKKMIGPRAERPPYEGHWYPYSSNGWGIFDFLNFCEAAGLVGIPTFDVNETPEDIADLMDYLNGAPDDEWGAKRVADGHPEPYRLKYIQLGNEERVDEAYYQKFKSLAGVIWARAPSVILVVGDFSYHKVITDPFQFTGADSGITTLAAHRKILQLAKQHDREVWFDLHVWTDGPRPCHSLDGMFSFIDSLEKISGGAKHKVVVFELNANNHSQRRAIANAMAIQAIQRDGRLPITLSANCLQPDGHNDNGWDQGLLFLNPSKVWFQPPGHAARMISANQQPLVVKCECPGGDLDVSATRSEDGKTLVLQIVNPGADETTASLNVSGFAPAGPVARVLTLSGPLDAANTARSPERIKPVDSEWKHGLEDGETTVTLPAHSFTLIRF